MFDPSTIRDDRLRALYDYWLSKAEAGRPPARARIDPVEISSLLSNLAILRVVGDAEDFVFVLAGTRIEQVHGRPLKGVSIFDLVEKMDGSPSLEHYREVARDCEPRYREGDLKFFGKGHWHSRRLLLPLSDDGSRVDMVLGAAFFTPRSETGAVA